MQSWGLINLRSRQHTHDSPNFLESDTHLLSLDYRVEKQFKDSSISATSAKIRYSNTSSCHWWDFTSQMKSALSVCGYQPSQAVLLGSYLSHVPTMIELIRSQKLKDNGTQGAISLRSLFNMDHEIENWTLISVWQVLSHASANRSLLSIAVFILLRKLVQISRCWQRDL